MSKRTLEICAVVSGFRVPATVHVDHQRDPGWVRIAGVALGKDAAVTISPADARAIAMALQDAATSAELEKRAQPELSY